MTYLWKKSKSPGGDFNPFFYCSFIEAVGFNNKYIYGCSFCHDIISSSSKIIEDKWVFCIINLFDEDNNERIIEFQKVLQKVNTVFTMPEFIINSNGDIEVYCIGKEFESRAKKLFLLKLLRFSYLSFDETIGQLFLNQRFYNYGMEDDYFYKHSDGNLLCDYPNTWTNIFDKKSKELNNLIGQNLNLTYDQDEFCCSLRDFKKQSLQLQAVPVPGLRVQLYASDSGF